MNRVVAAGSSACMLLAIAGESAAFCRTRTCEFDATVDCELDSITRCSTVGKVAYWGTGCMPYAIQMDGSRKEGISADELGAAVRDGFANWTSVSCGNGTPAFSVFDRGDIDCDEVEYNCEAGSANNNIIMFKDTTSSLAQAQLALSTLTANLDTGEIFDVDIEINSRDWDFRPGDSRDADLTQVINHELGHFLGLSHTVATGALMRAQYGGTSVPADDDIAGICAIYDHAAGNPACSVEGLAADAACVGSVGRCRIPVQSGEEGGCSCGLAAPASPVARWGWLGVALAAGGVWRRKRARDAAARAGASASGARSGVAT